MSDKYNETFNESDDFNKYIEMVNDYIIDKYQKEVRDKLISGESVEIPGVGVIKCKYRKVRNPYGREFTVRAVIQQDKTFSRDLIKSYKKNPALFNKS